MTRRHFIKKILLTSLQSMSILNLMSNSPPAAVASDSESESLHYKPLNGRSLRDIAQAKVHHNSEGFVSPIGLGRDGRFWEVMKWKFFSQNQFKKYYGQEEVVPVNIDWDPIRAHGGSSLTFLKHASVLIKDVDRYILVDPVFYEIFWFIKDFTPLLFEPRDMPRPQHILITHGHYDHLNKKSLASLNKNTHVISPLGYDDVFEALSMKNRTRLDWFDSFDDGRLNITLLPCNHWTMRNPIVGPNRSLWGSYVIRLRSGYTIYISGDTAYFDGFEQLGSEYKIDLAVFNLGAYEPRWFMAPSHTNPRETVQAFKELKADKLMVVHWGTFRLGNEPVHFPPLQVKEELKKEGLLDQLIDIKHGETLYLDTNGVVSV
jgi:L-ascorbate metabolism protein UlaG (beta-lactamase superfamily)